MSLLGRVLGLNDDTAEPNFGGWEHRPERTTASGPLPWLEGELHPDLPGSIGGSEVEETPPAFGSYELELPR